MPLDVSIEENSFCLLLVLLVGFRVVSLLLLRESVGFVWRRGSFTLLGFSCFCGLCSLCRRSRRGFFAERVFVKGVKWEVREELLCIALSWSELYRLCGEMPTVRACRGSFRDLYVYTLNDCFEQTLLREVETHDSAVPGSRVLFISRFLPTRAKIAY